MTKRDNHYEAAFEQYLRGWGVPYVAIDETRRSLVAQSADPSGGGEHESGRSIKNADFIVSPDSAVRYIVDVKGRRFPSGVKHKQYWTNWSTEDDLVGLRRWENFLGGNFQALLIFAFDLTADRSPLPVDRIFTFAKHRYAFLGVSLEDYLTESRIVSPRWRTFSMTAKRFREKATPIDELFGLLQPEPAS
jgi:hypothetical protein